MSLMREMKREVIDWARGEGWDVQERNHRYILRHPQLPESHKVFVSMQPQSPSAIPAARREIVNAMKLIGAPEPRAVPAIVKSQPQPQPKPIEEAKPVALSSTIDGDIIRDPRDDIMSNNPSWDRFKIGKHCWASDYSKEYIIKGKDPMKYQLYLIDAKTLGNEFAVGSAMWTSRLVARPPLGQFRVGENVYDITMKRWKILKVDPEQFTLNLEDQLGVKKTFGRGEIDFLRDSIDGIKSLRDRLTSRGEEIPSIMPTATGKPFADALAKANGNVVSINGHAPEPQAPAETAQKAEPKAETEATLRSGFIKHELLLRRGMMVYLDLPDDFNLEDSKRLCRLIDALAFD